LRCADSNPIVAGGSGTAADDERSADQMDNA